MAYLDDTGLAYFWGKIKAYIAALLAPKANDSDVVHKTGTETVGGDKTFVPDGVSETVNKSYYLVLRDKDFDRVSPDSYKHYVALVFADASGDIETTPFFGRMATVEAYAYPDANESALRLACKRASRVSASTDPWAIMALGVDANDIEYVTAPSTSIDRTNGQDVLTRNWIPRDTRIVHTTGNETIAGTKTFTYNIVINKNSPALIEKDSDVTRGVVPSSNIYRNLFIYCDTADDSIYRFYNTISKNSGNWFSILVYPISNTNNTYTRFELGYDDNGIAYAIAPSTSSSRSGNNDIVTRDWIPNDTRIVHTTGNETIAGNKTFTSHIIARSSDSMVCQDSDGEIVILADKDGGGSSSATQGAKLVLKGPASDGVGNYNSGRFVFIARNSANSNTLEGYASGDLLWSGTSIYIKRDGWNCFRNKQPGISSFKNYSTNIGWLGINQVVANDNSVIASVDVRYNGDYTDLSLGATSAEANSRGVAVILTVNKAYSDFAFRPNHNGTYNLGTNGNRWKQLFAATTTISTSDRRLKESIDSIPDAVLDAWDAVDWVQFKFSSSIAEKGQESARLHSGVIAQDIGEAFSGFGLDASRYGFFCYDRWDAEEASYDGDGNLKTEAREAGDAYSIRYEEALCMEAAYQRRENARLKKRVADLEERLAALELRLGSE